MSGSCHIFMNRTHSVQIRAFTVADRVISLNAGWNMLLSDSLFPDHPG